MYTQSFGQALRTNDQVIAASVRLDTVMSAYQQTMTVQAQVVENVAADARALSAIVAKSQGAEGSLQAQQATRSEEHTSELQSLMRTSDAVFCLKKKKSKVHTFVARYLKNTVLHMFHAIHSTHTIQT